MLAQRISRSTPSQTPRQVSFLDLAFGFLPAFRDLQSGETHLCVDAHGRPARMHLLDGLPRHWAEEFDAEGRITALHEHIMAGFLRQGRFHTLDELRLMRDD
ncbi:MAG: hypothetical protein D6717_06300 [Gammaproteobacteria bacterium]|nr:MAG: hypothetical protein D6717_06300 [Gammaproteobacteria bacterium]